MSKAAASYMDRLSHRPFLVLQTLRALYYNPCRFHSLMAGAAMQGACSSEMIVFPHLERPVYFLRSAVHTHSHADGTAVGSNLGCKDNLTCSAGILGIQPPTLRLTAAQSPGCYVIRPRLTFVPHRVRIICLLVGFYIRRWSSCCRTTTV